jgi:serine/threonine-protein kinase
VTASVYLADSLLGAGGAGRVYSATHQPSGRRVALKTLRSREDRGNTFGLLMREAAAVAQLHHPNIVELIDAVVHGERPYLVLELVEGSNVRDWLFEWPGWNTVLAALTELLDALSVAHSVGIVHRDIKPGNLLITTEGRLKITDFGIATVLNPLADPKDLVRGGTPRYMAPEQLDAGGHFGPWTDIYAVGVMLYEFLSGQSPLTGDRSSWQAEKLRPPPPLRARRELSIAPEVGAWVERMLDPNPAGRPRFAAQARRELLEIASGVKERRGPTSARGAPSSSPSGTHSVASALITASSIVSGFEDPATTPIARDGWWSDSDNPPLPSVTELPFEVPAPAEIGASTVLVSLRPPPLVARERERKLLSGTMASVIVARQPRALVFNGEAGVGKSRLARWALSEVERLGLMEGTAAAYEVSGTSDGLRQLLKRLFGPAHQIESRWRLGERGLDLAKLSAFSSSETEAAALPLSERVALALEALTLASRVFPLFIWLDDVGWARDGTHELVEALLDAKDAPIAIVMTVRAGTAEHPRLKPWLEALARHPHSTQRHIERFSATEIEALLSASAPLAPDVARELSQAVDDTPHGVIQLVQSLIASGELAPSPDGFRPVAGRSVKQLLERAPRASVLSGRVHKLIVGFGEDSQLAERVLLRAGLFGNRFSEAELRESIPNERDSRLIPLVIGQGLLHGILRLEPDLSNRFEHDFVREALLARLAGRNDAAELLRDVAEATLRLRGAQRWDAQVIAGRLLARAGDLDRALELVAEAAMDLGRLASYRQAEELLSEAREWVEAEPNHHRMARLLMAESMLPYFELDLPKAIELNRSAERHASLAGDEHKVTQCLADRADFYYYQHEFGSSERLARKALDRCDRQNPADAYPISFAAFRLAELASLRGELERAREHYELACEFAKKTPLQVKQPDLVGQDLALSELALIDFELAYGDKAAAKKRFDRLSALANDPRSGEWRTLLLETKFRMAVANGRGTELRGEMSAFMSELDGRGDVWRVTSIALLDAIAAAEAKHPPQVSRATDRFLAAFERCSHEKPFTFWALRTLAERLSALGQIQRADAVAKTLEGLRADVAKGFAKSSLT